MGGGISAGGGAIGGASGTGDGIGHSGSGRMLGGISGAGGVTGGISGPPGTGGGISGGARSGSIGAGMGCSRGGLVSLMPTGTRAARQGCPNANGRPEAAVHEV
jgi:hypothetical protein